MTDSPFRPTEAEAVHVALALDARCVIGCAVSMRSVLENASGRTPFVFHLACSGVSRSQRAKLAASVEGTDHPTRVYFSDWDPRWARSLARSKLISHTAYALLDLGQWVPAGVGRCISLDCDLVFERDVTRLWETDLGSRSVGAVENGSLAEARTYQRRLGLSKPSYFNSGVLLVNLDLWRARAVGPRSRSAAFDLGPLAILHDQDALNVALDGDWMELEIGWNSWTIIPGLDPSFPTVLHYAGAPKPWHPDYHRPFPERFYSYLDRTAFAGWRPWNPLGIGAFTKRVLRRLPSVHGLRRRLHLLRRSWPRSPT